jgi:hypothetical protein
MGSLKTISIIVAANIKGLEAGLGKANKSLKSFASNAARVGSTLSFGVSAPLTALGNSAFKAFREFETGMTKVAMVTQAGASDMKMLTQEAKRLGATTKFTATEVSGLQLVLGRKGFDPTAIKNMTGSILELSIATGEDLTLAADSVASSINAFQLESDEAGRVANTLALAAANSSIQLSTFSTAFGHAGASANAVGVDLEELSAMMGVLMDNGIKASKAGTGLRKVFMQMNEEGIPFRETLDSLANGSMTLNEAQELVGVTAANQLLILSKNKDKIAELTEEYKTNTGALGEMSDLAGKTADQKLKLMESAINAMQIEIGGLLADALLPMIRKITDLASRFGDLDDKTKKIILVVGGLLALLGPMLLIISGLTAAFMGLGVVIGALTSPIGLAIAAIAVLPIALKYVLDNWDAFAERLGDWSWWRNAIIQVLQWLVKYNPINLLLEGAQKLYDFLGIESEVFNPFDGLAEKLEDLKVETKEYKHEFGSLTDSIEDGLNRLDIKLPSLFGNTDSATATASAGTSKKEDKKEFVASPFDFQDEYKQYLADLEAAEAATQRFKNAIKDFGESISMSFADSFADVIVSGENLFEGLGNIFVELGKMMLKMIVKALLLSALLKMTGLSTIGGFGGAGTSGFKDILGQLMGGKFANGGRPPTGKMSLVGERGPELFVPDSAGTIIPNHALGGGGTVIPDVRISGDDLLIVFDRASRRKNRR